MTNFERIKAMSIEEMAELFDVLNENDICLKPKCKDCHECIYDEWCSNRHRKSIEWLESEVTK
jgi:hypothetical protein